MRMRRDDLVVRHLDGEVVMLCLLSSTYFSANGTGSYLVELLDEDRDALELAMRLSERSGVPIATATADVGAFLGQLRDHGLLSEG